MCAQTDANDTVLHLNAQTCEIDIDFVSHGDDYAEILSEDDNQPFIGPACLSGRE